jgi:von Willebrand factor type A domain
MIGVFSNWLQSWTGASGTGEGTVWSLDANWAWAPWITLLFALFVTLWVGLIYARERPAGRGYRALLAVIRLATIALVVLMIAEITLSLRRTGLPTVVVLIDDSASMGIADRYDDPKLRAALVNRLRQADLEDLTRLNLAKAVLLSGKQDLLTTIGRNYQLKVYFVSDTAAAQSGDLSELRTAIQDRQPIGGTTRLGAGLEHVLADLRGTPPAAILLLSDGINTDGETLTDAARSARRKGVPLLTVAIGSEQPVRDLELADLLVDEMVFVDDVVNFEFKLSGEGLGGRHVTVTLREQGQSEILAQADVMVPADGVTETVRLPYRPTEVGQFNYVVSVDPLAEEARTDNNRLERIVSVRKEQIRVLLVQAYPNYEFRYLKNMLERDSTIQLKTVLQDADLEYAELDQSALRGFPVRREDLFEYDVLIFGDVNPAFLSTGVMQNIADFAEKKGGGVAFIAGPLYTPLAYRHTPLAPLLPVDLETATTPGGDQADVITTGFRVVPTELGLASPQMQLGTNLADTKQIWANLPDLYWLLETPHLKPAARVLAEHPTLLGADGRKLAVISLQFVGAGKVLFHATDDTWRWRYRVGDVFFSRYWIQTIRYLSRSKLLGQDRAAELTTDRRQYHRGEPVHVRARFIDEGLAPAADDGVTVVVEQEGRKNQRVGLIRTASARGVFEGTLPGASDGNFHLWIATPTLEGGAPSADFVVVPPPGEFERMQVDVAELRRAAEETRGHFYRVSDVHSLAADLPRGRQVPIESLPPQPLWNQWWLISLFLGLITSEWLLRKRKGML